MSERAQRYQVGGDYYSRHRIQPWDIIREYSLSFFEGNALKYLLRKKPGVTRIEDLKKAKHYIETLIEDEERAAVAELRERQMGIAKKALAEARANIMAAYPPTAEQKRDSEEVRYWANMARAAEMEGLV
jgi:hypothetical protein